jgi:hypothetical protein
MGEMINAYKILVETLEGRRPLGNLRRIWVDAIGMGLKETGYGDVDRIQLA